MEIVHSIVANGVAQTPLQAQQVGRRRAVRSQQAYRQTREIQETAAIHLRAVDENDEGSAAGVHVSITGDLPEHHTPQSDPKDVTHPSHAAQGEDSAAVEATNASNAAATYTQEDITHPHDANDVHGPTLPPGYHHVDVKA